MNTHKTITSALLGLFFLLLLVLWGRYVMKLNATIHALQDDVQEVSASYDILSGKMEAEQNAHGAAQLEIQDLALRMEKLEELIKEQDAILLDISLQLQ